MKEGGSAVFSFLMAGCRGCVQAPVPVRASRRQRGLGQPGMQGLGAAGSVAAREQAHSVPAAYGPVGIHISPVFKSGGKSSLYFAI